MSVSKANDYASRPHILVIDDDKRIRELVCRYLDQHGFTVAAAEDAASAESILEIAKFDALVCDVMMPGEDGVSFTRRTRPLYNIPVIMLTALGEIENRINGLEAGADDYLPKPFDPRELVLRLKALLRRGARAAAPSAAQKIGPWAFDATARRLTQGGQDVQNLTEAEAQLLGIMTGRPGEILSREQLAKLAGIDGNDRAVDVQITRLRRKVEPDPANPRYIQTIRGKGYVLNQQESDKA